MRLCNGVHEKNQHHFVIKAITVVMNTFILVLVLTFYLPNSKVGKLMQNVSFVNH